MDEQTKEQKIAGEVVGCWYNGLTETAQSAISEHDLMALESMIADALVGDLDFLATTSESEDENNGTD